MESGVVSPSSPGIEAVRSFPSRWALSLQVSLGLSSRLRGSDSNTSLSDASINIPGQLNQFQNSAWAPVVFKAFQVIQL